MMPVVDVTIRLMVAITAQMMRNARRCGLVDRINHKYTVANPNAIIAPGTGKWIEVKSEPSMAKLGYCYSPIYVNKGDFKVYHML